MGACNGGVWWPRVVVACCCGVAWRGVACRGLSWLSWGRGVVACRRGVSLWRGVAWRGVSWWRVAVALKRLWPMCVPADLVCGCCGHANAGLPWWRVGRQICIHTDCLDGDASLRQRQVSVRDSGGEGGAG